MVIGICDDDKTWRRRAKRLLENWFENAGKEAEILCFSQGRELLEYKGGAALDLLFLDIELGEENGIAIARRVNEKWKHCQIVYLTNFLFYATEVYQTEHMFFVLKEQFERRLEEIFQKFFHQTRQKERSLIFSVIGGSRLCLAPDEILYLERLRRVTRVVTVWGDYAIWDKIDVLEQKLPKPDFLKCHSSYIVYLPAIREQRKSEFLMKNGDQIAISRSYLKKVKEGFLKWALTQMM